MRQHTSSESHVRNILLIGENPNQAISDFSSQFLSDFIQLLRTSHGEKKVMINHFYQDYIHNKDHVHMNATKWPSLTEFAKHLGREGICRVEEGEKGLSISWIDNSPEALRRLDAVRKKEMMERGDEEREQRLIRDQIKRAERDANVTEGTEKAPADQLVRTGEERIKLDFGTSLVGESSLRTSDEAVSEDRASTESKEPKAFSMAIKPVVKPRNVFATAKRKDSAADRSTQLIPVKAKMSNAEKIIIEEQRRKRHK